jgi:hypothetical protein
LFLHYFPQELWPLPICASNWRPAHCQYGGPVSISGGIHLAVSAGDGVGDRRGLSDYHTMNDLLKLVHSKKTRIDAMGFLHPVYILKRLSKK